MDSAVDQLWNLTRGQPFVDADLLACSIEQFADEVLDYRSS